MLLTGFDQCKDDPLDGANSPLTLQGEHIQHSLSFLISGHLMAVDKGKAQWDNDNICMYTKRTFKIPKKQTFPYGVSTYRSIRPSKMSGSSRPEPPIIPICTIRIHSKLWLKYALQKN